jgi:hypothetical protein
VRNDADCRAQGTDAEDAVAALANLISAQSHESEDAFHYSNGEEAAAHPTASPTGTRTAIVPGTVAEIPCFPRSGSMRVIQAPAGAVARSRSGSDRFRSFCGKTSKSV